MRKMFKVFVVIGCLLILLGVIMRITHFPIIIATKAVWPINLVILANTSFLLALLFKK